MTVHTSGTAAASVLGQARFDLEQLLDNMAAARAAYVINARTFAAFWCRNHGSVTADDLHAHCPPPPGMDGRILGCVLRRPTFMPIDFQPSVRRQTNHGRMIRRFQLGEGGSVSLAGRSSSAGSPSTLLPSLRRSS